MPQERWFFCLFVCFPRLGTNDSILTFTCPLLNKLRRTWKIFESSRLNTRNLLNDESHNLHDVSSLCNSRVKTTSTKIEFNICKV